METTVAILALFYSLGSSVFAAAQHCSLLQQCSSPQEILVNSNVNLVWTFAGTWISSNATFYRVPDGGKYNDSHRIAPDDPNFEISSRAGRLILVNVSAAHEGKYYCIYNGVELHPINSNCIVVAGRASLSCDDSRSTSYISSCKDESSNCTETIEVVRNSTLIFNTAISFVGSGACQTQQKVDTIQLKKNDTGIWGYSFEFNTNISTDDRLQLIRNGTFPFLLALQQAKDSDSGVYTLSVQLHGNSNHCLHKRFHVNVLPGSTHSPPTVETEPATSTSRTDPTTAAATITATALSQTSASNSTDPDPIPEFSVVTMAAIGAAVALIIVFVVILLILVCVAGKSRNNSTKTKYLDNSDRLSVYDEGFLQNCLYSPDDVRV